MEELQTKYWSIKTECEKREQMLINSISSFDDKLEHLRSRLSGITSQFKTQDERTDELISRVRKEFKQADSHLTD